jgi:hypothetical protein
MYETSYGVIRVAEVTANLNEKGEWLAVALIKHMYADCLEMAAIRAKRDAELFDQLCYEEGRE